MSTIVYPRSHDLGSLLLEVDPSEEDSTYAVTYDGNLVVKEEWLDDLSHHIKTIDYSYIGNFVHEEVRKVYEPDGIVISAQQTVTYSYAGGKVIGAISTRDI